MQLPGREERHGDRPFTSIEALVPALLDGIAPVLDLPFVVFGHSLGALVAFELTRSLRRRAMPMPRHLIAAAHPAPHRRKPRPPIHAMSADEIIGELSRLQGTPAEALGNAELMQAVLPLLRADFEMLDTHRHRDEPPLDVPVLAVGGTADSDVSEDGLRAWREMTTQPTRVQLFAGGHFFIHTQRDLLLREVAGVLEGVAGSAAPAQ